MIVCILLFLASTLSSATLLAPSSFSWDNYNGTSFLLSVPNQNFPSACNSGWAFSTINVLNSRIKIKRRAASPDISLSVQVLLSCDTSDYGCLGGEPLTAFKWIQTNNITDDSCHAYRAKGYTNGETCTSKAKCQACSDGKCSSVGNSKIYAIHRRGTISGQAEMMEEIQTYGPIACGMSGSPLQNYTKNTILDVNGSKKADHFVMVYGWGQNQQGQKYWLVRNSYGPNWGNSGNFMIAKGKNTLGIQARCFWASVRDTWTNDVRNKTLPNLQSYAPSNLQTYQLPSYLSPSRSSLTPNSCKSSWAFAIVHMLADRQNNLTSGKQPILLSVQALINCGVGSCEKGGNPFDGLNFIQKYGLPEQGCQTYEGKTPEKQTCTLIQNCAGCKGTVFQSKCESKSNFKRWKIYDFGEISGIQNMKNQIFSWGPIICGLHASKAFHDYKGGILSEVSIAPKIDHYVEVLGWGEEAGKKYWFGRNSWGTSWGESSFFRIQMGSNNLGIQTHCYFGNSLM